MYIPNSGDLENDKAMSAPFIKALPLEYLSSKYLSEVGLWQLDCTPAKFLTITT